MTGTVILDALQIPAEARVDQRITKKLLLERVRGTPAQKRSLQDGIEELLWVASLKPHTVGVAAYRDDVREYLEIAVLQVRLRHKSSPATKSTRVSGTKLVELIHRAIPYPVLLIAEQDEQISISVAEKRWSEAEHGETVTEQFQQVTLTDNDPSLTALFLRSMAAGDVLGAGTRALDMRALYQRWTDRLTAFEASHIAGTYTVSRTPEDASALRQAMRDHAMLARQVSGLRTQAQKEVQVSRRVELNIAVKRLEAEMAALVSHFGQRDLRKQRNDEAD